MLLDEPTTYLDIANQLEVLELVRQLNQDKHRTMVLVLHDLMLAARYADHMIVMADGKIVATGEVSEVLTEDLLADVFKIRAQISTDPATGRPLVIPLSSLRPQHTFQPVGSNEASVRR